MGSRQHPSAALAWGRQRIVAAGLAAFALGMLSGAAAHALGTFPMPVPSPPVMVAVPLPPPPPLTEPVKPEESSVLPPLPPPPAPPIPPAREPGGASYITSIDRLTDLIGDLGYRVEGVRDRGDRVPRLYLARLPSDFDKLQSPDQRRAVFIQALLPLVLRINEEILADRRNLIRIYELIAGGFPVGPQDRDWLAQLARRYEANPSDPLGLLARVDVVPPSLALAQAGEESGWGSSRSARFANSLFGQMAAGSAARLRLFDRLSEGVEAYIHNLNTHRAYESFRAIRATERRAGRSLDGAHLAAGLTRYSERGAAYIDSVRAHIRANRLHLLDAARLYGRDESRWAMGPTYNLRNP